MLRSQLKGVTDKWNYLNEVERMCPIAKGPHHGPAPIPEEGRWVKAYQISDISGLSHGIGWCAPQQGCCKLTLNVKDGIIQEALDLKLAGLLRYDPFRCNGWRDSPRKNSSGSTQH